MSCFVSGSGGVKVDPQGEPVSFAAASDQRIAELIDLADQGLIDLERDLGWAIGDEREYTTGSMWYTCVIAARANEYTLVTPLKDGSTKGHFIVLCKYYYSDDQICINYTDEQGTTKLTDWSVCVTPTNENSLLTGMFGYVGLSSSAKSFYCPYTKIIDRNLNIQLVTDFQTKVGTPTEVEYFGQLTYSPSVEATLFTQWPYFENPNNRIFLQYRSGTSYSKTNTASRSPVVQNFETASSNPFLIAAVSNATGTAGQPSWANSQSGQTPTKGLLWFIII